MSGFYLSYDALYEAVVAIGIIFFLQTGLEGPGEDLIESGSSRPEEGLYDFVAGLIALAIDEFDEQLAL